MVAKTRAAWHTRRAAQAAAAREHSPAPALEGWCGGALRTRSSGVGAQHEQRFIDRREDGTACERDVARAYLNSRACQP